MPGRADALAAQVRGRRGSAPSERHQRGQRLLHERGDGDEVGALVAGQQQLGLVGDGEVGPAGLAGASAAPPGPAA